MRNRMLKLGVVGILVTGIAFANAAMAQKKQLTVSPCDGGEAVAMPGYTEGERLSREKAQGLADELMAKWLERQEATIAASWRTERDRARGPAEPETSDAAVQEPLQTTDLNARDRAVWEREIAREVAYGDKIFHDDKLIGSPEGIACAMCHPNASNTHPETYPKFQVQLKKVALLRDMINWCIENPIRGKKLDADDPKMRALEAYILSQRKGVALEYGKH